MGTVLEDGSREVAKLQAEIVGLQLEKALLQADYNRLQKLYDRAPLGYQSLDEDGVFLTVNQAWLDLLGYCREEVIGRSFADFLHPEWQDHFRENFPRFKAIGEILGVEFEMRRKDGQFILVTFDGRIGRDADGRFQQTHCICRDITERRAEEARREAERRLLRICHLAADTRDLIASLVTFFQDLTGCEAVGIRLRQGEDYPYYESSGFPPHFLCSENLLCELTPEGNILRDDIGNPVLACMCGNILRGRFDPTLPFFSENGSFWTNSTTQLLSATSEADRQARTRNRCNGEGYESVALIPFRLRDETYGLLQLNDRTPDRFPPELIKLLEELATYVSLSLSKHLADSFRQETEEKYRLLVERAHEGIIITARQRLLLINPAAVRISGYSSAELSTKTFADLIHPDDLAPVVERHERRLRGETVSETYSFRIIAGDGRIKWVEVNGALIQWQGGPATLNFVTDVTARRQAEEALCASEKLLKATQRLTRAGGWEWNLVTGGVTWTEETYRIHDVEPGEIPSGSPELTARSLACFHPADRPIIEAALQRCAGFGVPCDREYPFFTAKGRRLWTRLTAEPVWSGGRIVKVVGSIVDITEQRRATNRLRQNEATMRAILEASRESIHLIDAQGKVLMANTVTAERLGLTPETLIGRNVFDLFPPELAKSRMALMRQVLDSSLPLTVADERQNRCYETSLYPVVDAKGRPTMVAVFSQDVSDRKVTELALQASENRYRALFEQSPVAVWEEDFSEVKHRIDLLRQDGITDLRSFLRDNPDEVATLAGMVKVIDINHHSAVILGASGKEEVFRDLGRYFTSESLEVFADVLAALASGRTRFEAEIPVVDIRSRPLVLDLTLSIDPANLSSWSRVLVSFVDISTRKRNERQLRQQAMILDQISDAVTVTDLDGMITYVNKAAAGTFGRSRQELVGRHVGILGYDPQYGASQQQMIENTLMHGSWRDEMVNFTPTGRRILMDCRIGTLFDDSGRKIGMCGIATNITEKRRTEDLLKARLRLSEEAANLPVEKLLQLALTEAELLTGSQAGFFHFLACDQQTITHGAWSPATLRFCREETMHCGLAEAGIWADAIRQRQPVIHNQLAILPGARNLPAQHLVIERELVVPVIRAGSVVAVLAVGNKPSDYDRRDVDLVSSLADMVLDIVLRKRAEQALKASEEWFRGIFEVSPAGIALADPVSQRFLRANRSFLEIVGYAAEELLGMKIGDLTHPDDWAEEKARLARKFSSPGGNHYILEKRYIRKDGTVRWVQLMADCLQFGDAEPVLIANVVDITERVRAEENSRLDEARLESLLRISQYPAGNTQELLDYALAEAISLTDSKIGYIYLYDEGQEKFTLNSWSREVMERCRVVESQTVYHLQHTGLWGEAVRQRRPVVDNDYSSSGHLKKGVPEGHVALSRFLTVPVFSDGRIVAVAGVANKGSDYDDQDIRQLILMMDSVWKVVRQRQAEAEREDTLRRLRLATGSAKLGVWDWDVVSGRRIWDERMYEMYGSERRKSSTVAIWAKTLHPEDRERVTAEIRTTLAGKGAFDTTFRIVLGNGEVRHIKADGLVVRDHQGQPLRMLGVNRDITDQCRAEEALRASEEQHRSLVRMLPDIICQFDYRRRLVFISENISHYLDFRPEELLGHTFAKLGFSADLHRQWDAAIDEAFATSRTIEFEFPIDTRSGQSIFNWRLMPQRDQEGRIRSVLVMARDITDHRRAEREYRQLFEAMLDGCALHEIVLDENGLPSDYRFLAVNPAFERMTGLKAEEVVGRTLLEMMPKTENYWVEKYGRVALTGEPANFENYSSVLGKYFQVTAFQPALRQFACIFSDITEQVKAEQEREKLETQLRQAQKLEAIGTLAGGIAHDFNNILTAILGYAEIAREECQPGSPIAKDVEEVITAGKRARDLVKQILAFSRQATIERIPLQPSLIVREAIKLLRSSFPTTIRIIEDIDGNAGQIFADPTQVHQVLMNLCTNAYHAMEESGGVMTISLQKRSSTTAELQGCPEALPGEYVHLSVRDTGPGIPPDIRERIFDPYFTTKEQGKGTGLGLAIVRGIVISCGGFVTCRSTLGEGSEFCACFPAHGQNDNPIFSPDTRDAGAEGGNERILFVDDEEVLVEMGRTMLERMGYKVTGITDSRAALDTFTRQPEQFDLVITDQTMPGMTGMELARAIFQIRPEMPVILCTGYSNLVTEESALANGIRAFALKPLIKKDLAHLIRNTLESWKA